MPEELGTKDVLAQVDSRLGTVEQDVRMLRVEMNEGFQSLRRELNEGLAGLRREVHGESDKVRGEASSFRSEVNARFESQTRWLVGLIFASWITVIASIWLKP